MEKRSIYPAISINIFAYHDNSFRIVLESWLRKRKGLLGKYYLQKFYREIVLSDINELYIHLNQLHAEVYKSIILGKVDLRLVFHTPFGVLVPAFVLDEDQRSEKERMSK